MAVFTPVSPSQARAFLSAYDLGELEQIDGICEGIENTNYRLGVSRGQFILTLFERRTRTADLPYFLGLMRWLSARGYRCPTPVADRRGRELGSLCGRPAALTSFLEGRPDATPGPTACGEAGEALARLHLAAEGFPLHRSNDLGSTSWTALFQPLRERAEALRPGLAATVARDLDLLRRQWPGGLAEGPIHADFFPDNVFFQVGRFAGAIDFYFACDDLLAYDLAIALGAWCGKAGGALDPDRGAAMIAGYERRRPLSPDERRALPTLAFGAAMRFFLTRLGDWGERREGAMVTPKDPMIYVERLDALRPAVERGEAFTWASAT